MKNIFKTVAALAAVVLAGCTTDFNDEIIAPQGGKTTVTVGLPESRTSLGELVDGTRKVYWSNGDMIVINGVTSAPTTIAEDNAGVATFEFDGVLNRPYSVFYPAELWKNNSTITLPAVQAYKSGSFAEDLAPMACYAAEDAALQLHHLAAVVRLQVKLAAENADAHKINRIEFRGNNNEQISGDFTLDYAAATLTSASTAEADKAVKVSFGKALAAEATDFFVVVPAGEYSKGFTIRVVDNNGHYMEKSTGAISLAKGEIKAMPEFEFVPTHTTADVEIATAAQLVAFAKAYNAGDYWNVQPFIVHLTADIVFDDDTNAAWEPIGNIFTADNKLGLDANTTNYFHGNFQGNGFAIKNWKSGQPLFDFTGSGSLIEGVVIDSSCTLAVDCSKLENYGTFVGYHRGDILNCQNNANITATGTAVGNTRIGGFVGRSVVGSVVGCSMNGDITADANLLSNGGVYLGGIIGGNTNAEGYVKNSHMTGNITFNGGVAKNTGSYFIGGIAGFMRGACTGCTTTKADATTAITVTPAAKDFASAYVGGMVGQVDTAGSVKDCTNSANITFNIPNATYGTTGISVAGIVGNMTANIDNVTNNGNVYVTPTENSLCHHVWVGGVVGLAGLSSVTEMKISNATNNGEVLFVGYNTSAASEELQHYWIAVGGILGYDLKETANTIESCTNNGLVGASFKNKLNGRATSIGGIAGMLYYTASKMKSCTNNGYIFNQNFNNTNVAKLPAGGGALAGGLVGYAAGSTSEAGGDVYVTIEDCHNNCVAAPTSIAGALHATPTANIGVYSQRGIAGGLVGYACYANITKCTCATKISQTQNGYVGGLVAWTNVATVSECKMIGGEINIGNANTVAAGGLVGIAQTGTITNNTFNSVVSGSKCTAVGVLVGNADAATKTTDNKVKGTFFDEAITLSTAMVGTGTAATGTELYTE